MWNTKKSTHTCAWSRAQVSHSELYWVKREIILPFTNLTHTFETMGEYATRHKCLHSYLIYRPLWMQCSCCRCKNVDTTLLEPIVLCSKMVRYMIYRKPVMGAYGDCQFWPHSKSGSYLAFSASVLWVTHRNQISLKVFKSIDQHDTWGCHDGDHFKERFVMTAYVF